MTYDGIVVDQLNKNGVTAEPPLVLLIILELLVTFPPHTFKQSLGPFLFSS
jgi:hypothetical protein